MRVTRYNYRNIFASFMTAAILAGCGGENTSQSSSVTEQEVISTETPTDLQLAQPTESTAPSSDISPTVATESAQHEPIMVDGIDFYEYYTKEKSIGEFISEMSYDTARMILILDNNVSSIIKNGDSVSWNSNCVVELHLYSPKKVESMKSLMDDELIPWQISDDNTIPFKGTAWTVGSSWGIISMNDFEVKYQINYTDGTSEILSFNLTISEAIERVDQIVIKPSYSIPDSAENTVHNEYDIINGIDFSLYNNHLVDLPACVESQGVTFNELSVVVVGNADKTRRVITILKNGDSFECTEDMDVDFYFFGSKTITSLSCVSNGNFVTSLTPSTGAVRGECGFISECKDLEITCEAKYADNTKERHTFYLTLKKSTIAATNTVETTSGVSVDEADFSKYNSHEMPVAVFVERNNIKFDQLSVVVTGLVNDEIKVLKILKDGDSLEEKIDTKIAFYFFGKKKITDIKCVNNSDILTLIESSTGNVIGYTYDLSYINQSITFEVTYEDGSNESIEFYLTLE